MKKICFIVILFLTLFIGITVNAQDIIKIQQNGVVKRAKEFGSGNGITFTLPELSDSNFIIDSIELAIFEKKLDNTNYSIFGNTKLIESPTSLNVSFDFGDIAKYEENAKYKIAYRYYTKAVDDFSKIEIAGQDIKDGWRLVGEVNPILSNNNGFSFYLNSAPNILINRISYIGEDILGAKTFTYTPEQIKNVYLPKTSLEKGITIDYTTTDFDMEDTLTVHYKLIDKLENTVIVDSVLGSDKKIIDGTTAKYVDLIFYVVDNWGKSTEIAPITLNIDREVPFIVSEFQDMGKSIRGKNLYSKFVITDDQNAPLKNGIVYYTVKRNGVQIIGLTRFLNNPNGEYPINRANLLDGNYEINLTIFDKAYNKITHTLSLTLDNTPPTLNYLTPNEDDGATLYNTWVNDNKNIVVDVEDVSGVKKTSCIEGSVDIYSSNSSGIKVIPIPNKTGKLNFSISVEDNAYSLDKTNNTVNLSSVGNISNFSNGVWIDKTAPSVTIGADENTWYLPTTIIADFYDYESIIGKGDNSGIKLREYQIGDTITENWLTYTNGVAFETGGIYYLHIRATDYAGNETIVSKKIKINTQSIIIGKVTPTNNYMHTIYQSVNDIYVIKNTAYNTKYQFKVQDNDINDIVRADVQLISEDNNSIFATTTVDVAPNGNILRDVVFNLSYLDADGAPLPDGVYTMYLTVSEVKNDNEVLTLNRDIKGCEVVIKRSSPPIPIISVSDVTDGKKITIDYPNETLANSLNNDYIKALYKREYKIVKDNEADSNVYKSYITPISPINDDCTVTALYTDPAGNISTATLRIYANIETAKTIKKDGNTVTVEESRPATIYYIGTRRNKQSGIDSDALKFIK
jgi:hypothetical protein